MNRSLLKKYLCNSCTDEELESVVEWLKSHKGSIEGKSMLHELWEELTDEGDFHDIDFSQLLDTIHHNINLSETRLLIDESGQNLIKGRRIGSLLKVITRAAAVLFLPLAGVLAWHLSQNASAEQNLSYNESFSSVDAITKVILPDGTKVWLNHSSSIKYPAVFNGKSRDVELNGEAYFEVTHNPKIPFVVNVGDLQVCAHGTTFNIYGYTEDERIETSLIEGNVEIKKKNIDGTTISYQMKPLDRFIYSKSDKKITSSKCEFKNYAWKDGKLVFKNASIDEVVKKLSRWYNVDISLKDSILNNFTYTATINQETLPQVLELISLATPVNYSITQRDKLSNGDFTKRKVVLSYRNNK